MDSKDLQCSSCAYKSNPSWENSHTHAHAHIYTCRYTFKSLDVNAYMYLHTIFTYTLLMHQYIHMSTCDCMCVCLLWIAADALSADVRQTCQEGKNVKMQMYCKQEEFDEFVTEAWQARRRQSKSGRARQGTEIYAERKCGITQRIYN